MTPPEPHAPGRVIFINGVPAAGKSTVAAKLRAVMRGPTTVRTDDAVIAVRNSYRVRGCEVDPVTLSAESWARVLKLAQDALVSGNVVVDGAMTERQVRETKDAFGDKALFVVLKITEESRQRRQRARDREGRRLASPLGGDAHSMTGPDELYDLVIDAEATSPKGCAREVVALARERWPGAQL